jgi:hypothetical protein
MDPVVLAIYAVLGIILILTKKWFDNSIKSNKKYLKAYVHLFPNLLGGIVGGAAVGLIFFIEGKPGSDWISGILTIMIVCLLVLHGAVQMQSKWEK